MSTSPSPGRFLSREEIDRLGLAAVGRHVLIDRAVTFLRPDRIRIGDRSRIDLGVVLSAGEQGITIEENVHVAANCLLFGGGGPITLRAFSGLSSQVVCYTATDDYTGDYLFGPTVPEQYRNVQCGPVFLDHLVLVGSGSLLLPNAVIGAGAVICAQTVISRDVAAGTILVGRPPRQIGQRDVDKLRAKAREYLVSIGETALADGIAPQS